MICQGACELSREGTEAIPELNVAGEESDDFSHSLFRRSISWSGYFPRLQVVLSCLHNVCIEHPVAVRFLNSLHEGVLPSIAVILHPWIAQ